MRASKQILEEMQEKQRSVLQSQVQWNGAKAKLEEKKKLLLQVTKESLGKRKTSRLSTLQREVSSLREEVECFGILTVDLEDGVLSLQRELVLSQIYEQDIAAYLESERQYFQNITDVSRIVTSIRKLMTHLQQLSQNLKSPAEMKNLISRLMNRSELLEIDFEAFLTGQVQADDGKNEVFKDKQLGIGGSLFEAKIAKRFYVPAKSLPTAEWESELDGWASIWRTVHLKLLGRHPTQQERPDRITSTFRQLKSQTPVDPFTLRKEQAGRVRS
ncbi:MAG: hypothetical protein ACLQVJ_12380 [Syntrophobacteraceae bacterium]